MLANAFTNVYKYNLIVKRYRIFFLSEQMPDFHLQLR